MGFVVVGAVLAAILVLLSGYRRVSVLEFKPGPLVVRMPFGSSPTSVGRAIGIDGRLYGPLTFATNGNMTVVADTYRERLLEFSKDRMTAVATPGKMVEDLAVAPSGSVVMADNRTLSIWMLDQGKFKKIVQFQTHSGYSEALWHIGIGSPSRMFVERVQFGHGAFAARLDEYTLSGRFVRRLAEAQGSRGGGLMPLASSVISEPVRNFQVAPDGNLYIEPVGLNSLSRTIRIYRPNGLLMGEVVVRAPVAIERSDLLGISRQGWIYLAVNIDVPHKARVLIVSPEGHVIGDLHVPAVPIYAANYGRVLPSGVLYLDDSTPNAYQIRIYRPTHRKVWRWGGF